MTGYPIPENRAVLKFGMVITVEVCLRQSTRAAQCRLEMEEKKRGAVSPEQRATEKWTATPSGREESSSKFKSLVDHKAAKRTGIDQRLTERIKGGECCDQTGSIIKEA